MSIREKIAHLLFDDLIQREITAAVSIRIDDSPGWDTITAGHGPADRPWADRLDDLDDALEAWRLNFIVRRIVTLTRSYVVGNGILISSRRPAIDRWVQQFVHHPKNRLYRRLGPMCDELTRSGELFPILFTNRVDGMSYIRFIPASRIRELDCDPNDYETELRYGELMSTGDLRWWLSPHHPDTAQFPRNCQAVSKKLHPEGGQTSPLIGGTEGGLPPVMCHFTVNRPIGATRGEGDLVPVLPWALRYSEWLKDRVRLNRQRTRQGMMDLEIADDSMVREKRQQLRTSQPLESGIYIHGPGEKVTFHNLRIDANDAERDGRVLRLAIAAGGNVALHYLGEGESTNYATARAMGEPTARFFTDRQGELCDMLLDLVTQAYHRRVLSGHGKLPAGGDLQLQTSVTEVAREDNETLARSANLIVRALAEMKLNGWIDDVTAITLAFKFAGEAIGEEEITSILANATTKPILP